MASAWLDAHALRHGAASSVGSSRPTVDTQPAQRRDDFSDLDDELDDGEDRDDADDLDDEPSLQDLADDDDLEPFDPGDDTDLDLDASDDETVGLDTAEGFEETADDLELDDTNEDAEEDEEGGWDDSDPEADDANELQGLESDADSEPDDADAQEYGWIDHGEEDGEFDDDGLDDDLDDEPEAARDDGGAEGLEDDSDFDDLDLSHLPALDLNAEEEVGLPGLDETDELDGFGLLDEPVVEIAPGQTWKMLRARTTRTSRIAWPPDSRIARAEGWLDARSLATRGQTLFLASGGLYCLEPQQQTFKVLPLEAAPATGPAVNAQSVLVAEHEDVLQLAVIAQGRLHFSSDQGQTFSVQESPKVTCAGYTHTAAGLRLWWSTVEGTLGSDSGTVSLPQSLGGKAGQVLALHADARRSLAWLEQRDGRLQLVASADGGKSFATWSTRLPAADAGVLAQRVQIEACGAALLIAACGEPLCAVHGAELEPLSAVVLEPVTLADEEGEPFLFGCVEREDEWLIIRRAARTNRAAPLVLASIGKRELGSPLALAVGYGEDGMLSLFVAGTAALMRVEVSLDGEEIA